MKKEGYFECSADPLIRIYMNPALRDHKTYTLALSQLEIASSMDGVLSPVIGMPDLSPAYGLPVGGVLATDAEKGVISLSAIGGDIGCGISLSQTGIPAGEFIYNGLDRNLCSELAEKIKMNLSKKTDARYSKLLIEGAQAVAEPAETSKIENYGKIDTDPLIIDDKMIAKAEQQYGTLGGGNHFIDLVYCSEIFDQDLAVLWDLEKDSVMHMIHTGSRGIGNLISEAYSKPLDSFDLTDRIFKPLRFNSDQGRQVLDAVSMAENFAYANRALLRKHVDEALRHIGKIEGSSRLIYDFSHNSISLEEFDSKKIVLHRKGSSRGFPAEHQSNTDYYKDTGHPIIIPGSLGTATYVLVGTDKLAETFFSMNHGAGRKYSRGYVRSKKNQPRFRNFPEELFVNQKFKDYCEEVPGAYKDIEDVIGTLEQNGFVRRVAKLTPFFVYVEKDSKLSHRKSFKRSSPIHI